MRFDFYRYPLAVLCIAIIHLNSSFTFYICEQFFILHFQNHTPSNKVSNDKTEEPVLVNLQDPDKKEVNDNIIEDKSPQEWLIIALVMDRVFCCIYNFCFGGIVLFLLVKSLIHDGDFGGT